MPSSLTQLGLGRLPVQRHRRQSARGRRRRRRRGTTTGRRGRRRRTRTVGSCEKKPVKTFVWSNSTCFRTARTRQYMYVRYVRVLPYYCTRTLLTGCVGSELSPAMLADYKGVGRDDGRQGLGHGRRRVRTCPLRRRR